jgi:hypothetical protein
MSVTLLLFFHGIHFTVFGLRKPRVASYAPLRKLLRLGASVHFVSFLFYAREFIPQSGTNN